MGGGWSRLGKRDFRSDVALYTGLRGGWKGRDKHFGFTEAAPGWLIFGVEKGEVDSVRPI